MSEKDEDYFQMDLFGSLSGAKNFRFKKPIRLIEFFAGYGSQSLAMKYLGLDYESWRICEWNWKSFEAYKALHTEDDEDYSKGKTKQELQDTLFDKGISSDWNKPCTLKQIKAMDESQLRAIYNAMIATKNLVDISRVKADDLSIERERERSHCYVACYSFPCQDLSLAGKRKLGHKGSGTRSGLLWEFERIMKELTEKEERPDVLLMENVIQVHGKGSEKDFADWLISLESMGYRNYWKDLNADDYGVPQTRKRCFMVSILWNDLYEFPKGIELEYRLKDLLVKKAQEKYYLTEQQMKNITLWNNTPNRMNEENLRERENNSGRTLTTHAGTNDYNCNYIPIKEATKKGYKEAEGGDGVYTSAIDKKRGTVQKGEIQTIKTSLDVGVVTGNESRSKD